MDDELSAKVKQSQIKVEKSFSHSTTNRLNRTHRPAYLLSGMLECNICAGLYAIMAKDRYGCTNRQRNCRSNISRTKSVQVQKQSAGMNSSDVYSMLPLSVSISLLWSYRTCERLEGRE
ncbi:hypothetical protein DXM21_24520 [Agrobacterium rosae]|nr:hypothetical protein DXM21_24520 [Agrobacterium rosae]KAA3512567.1 hypothetical protein DXM25_24710 [Agrobacterium rosae]MQB51272.1 hypothetical protein [Agrobacterium rosae]